MDIMLVILLFAVPILLLFSAFFSGSETAMFSLSQHQRGQLASEDSITGRTLTQLLAETRHLLITLLLGNMIINVSYFTVSSIVALRLGRLDTLPDWMPLLFNVLALILLILFGEVLPKLIATRLTMLLARFAALPLLTFHRAIFAVRWFANLFVITPLARLIAPTQSTPPLTASELESLLKLSQDRGVINTDEERLLQQALSLRQIKVRDLMIPRVDLVAFDLNSDPAKLIPLIREQRKRQIPVYRENLDQIEGVIHAREAMLNPPINRYQLRKLIRQTRFVPMIQHADQLLVDFRKTGTSAAMVVDEYGGTAGLVSLRDVVRFLLGNLAGDADGDGQPELEQLAPGKWRASARLSAREWAGLFQLTPISQQLPILEAASTLGGLVMAALGRLPKAQDAVTIGNVRLTVEAMDGRRIRSVLVELGPLAPYHEGVSP